MPPAMMLLARLQWHDLAQELSPKVDAAWRELLSAMLARQPDHRPAMDEVHRRLAAGT